MDLILKLIISLICVRSCNAKMKPQYVSDICNLPATDFARGSGIILVGRDPQIRLDKVGHYIQDPLCHIG